jgi:hypothetical protein
MMKLAEDVLLNLDECAQGGRPTLSTERGNFYLSSEVPAARIVLTIPTQAYLDVLIGLPGSARPYGHEVVVTAGRRFQIALFSLGGVSIENGTAVKLGQRIVTVI